MLLELYSDDHFLEYLDAADKKCRTEFCEKCDNCENCSLLINEDDTCVASVLGEAYRKFYNKLEMEHWANSGQ